VIDLMPNEQFCKLSMARTRCCTFDEMMMMVSALY